MHREVKKAESMYREVKKAELAMYTYRSAFSRPSTFPESACSRNTFIELFTYKTIKDILIIKSTFMRYSLPAKVHKVIIPLNTFSLVCI